MKLPVGNFLHPLAAAAALPNLSRIAKAQAYPSRPISIVATFPGRRRDRRRDAHSCERLV